MEWCCKPFYIMIDELLYDATRLSTYAPDVKYYEQSLVLRILVSIFQKRPLLKFRKEILN